MGDLKQQAKTEKGIVYVGQSGPLLRFFDRFIRYKVAGTITFLREGFYQILALAQ